jgi:serpin B
MLTRRDTLRLLGLAGLAGSPLLAACGAHPDPATSPAAHPPIRLVGADVPRAAGDPAAVPDVVTSLGAFTGDLWPLLAPEDNLAISPYSIAVALAMTANGAGGSTRTQMLDVLHADELTSYNGGLDALTQQIEGLAGPVTLANGKKGAIELAAVDQLFGDHSITWRPDFLDALARMYGAAMRTVDFALDPDAARTLINAWTAQQTHDRIPELLPPGVVDPSTRLVLVNALYLKAPWDMPFARTSTMRAAFHRADGSTVSVPMMHGDPESGYRYLRGDHYLGARLPYRDGTLAMTVAVPNTGQEGAALDELLSGGLAERGQSGLTLSLPRWTFRAATDLAAPLGTLGMAAAFTPAADFSPMTADERLFLQFVLHQTYVAVDEDGTEAAAATAVGMTDSGFIGGPELVVDRPFLFVIHDTAHGTPLFVGRVADPTA